LQYVLKIGTVHFNFMGTLIMLQALIVCLILLVTSKYFVCMWNFLVNHRSADAASHDMMRSHDRLTHTHTHTERERAFYRSRTEPIRHRKKWLLIRSERTSGSGSGEWWNHDQSRASVSFRLLTLLIKQINAVLQNINTCVDLNNSSFL